MTALTQSSSLPSRHAVRIVLEGLTGRDIDLKDGRPVEPRTTNVVAVYVTDKLATSALCVVTIEGAARLGGALGLLPRGGVEDCIAGRDLDGPVRENCYEVLNVLSAVFNTPNAPHVRLYTMYGPNETVPTDVAALSAAVGNRMDVAFTVAGYGDGMLSLVVHPGAPL
jgi:hypothetical protein